MSRFRMLAVGAAIATGLSLAIVAPVQAAPRSPSGNGLSARTITQIDALARAKTLRTPTEQKIDSQLLTEITQRSGRSVAAGVGRLPHRGAHRQAGADPRRCPRQRNRRGRRGEGCRWACARRLPARRRRSARTSRSAR